MASRKRASKKSTKRKRAAKRGSTARAKSTATVVEQSKPAVPAPAPTPPPVDPNAWRLVNRHQLAELIGTHPDTVSDHTRSGMPVVERGGHGKESVYDAVDCLNWWREQQGVSAKDAAHTRALNAQADISEQKLRKERGELVSRRSVELAFQSIQKGWSVRIQAVPRRLVQIGIVTREREAAALTIVKEVLNDIATWRGVEEQTTTSNPQLPTTAVDTAAAPPEPAHA